MLLPYLLFLLMYRKKLLFEINSPFCLYCK